MINKDSTDAQAIMHEAAGRLATAIQVIRHNEDPDDHNPDCLGWDMTVVEEIIEDVAESLRVAAKGMTKEGKA